MNGILTILTTDDNLQECINDTLTFRELPDEKQLSVFESYNYFLQFYAQKLQLAATSRSLSITVGRNNHF